MDLSRFQNKEEPMSLFGLSPAQIATFAGMRNRDVDQAQGLIESLSANKVRNASALHHKANALHKAAQINEIINPPRFEVEAGGKKYMVKEKQLGPMLKAGAKLRETAENIQALRALKSQRNAMAGLANARTGEVATKQNRITQAIQAIKSGKASPADWALMGSSGASIYNKQQELPKDKEIAAGKLSGTGKNEDPAIQKRVQRRREAITDFFHQDTPLAQRKTWVRSLNSQPLGPEGIFYIDDDEPKSFSSPDVTEEKIQAIMKGENITRLQAVELILNYKGLR